MNSGPITLHTTTMALTENTPVYFWKPDGENGVFGQWYPSSFVWTQGTETFNYANAEQ